MAIQDWSEDIIMVELNDDPDFTDEVNQVTERVERQARDVVLNFSQVKFLNS